MRALRQRATGPLSGSSRPARAAASRRSTSSWDRTLGSGRPRRGPSSTVVGSVERWPSAKRKRWNCRTAESRRAAEAGFSPSRSSLAR